MQLLWIFHTLINVLLFDLFQYNWKILKSCASSEGYQYSQNNKVIDRGVMEINDHMHTIKLTLPSCDVWSTLSLQQEGLLVFSWKDNLLVRSSLELTLMSV